MPVRAFVDDSGSGGDSRYFVLGGFLADFDTWATFADAWDAELSKPPAIEYFKMAEANALNEQFDGWNEHERDAKVNALIDVIHAHKLFQGTCAINSDDYDSVVVPVLGNRFRNQYNDPYLFLFMGIIGHFTAMEFRWEHAQRGVPPDKLVIFDKDAHTGSPPERVDFVFDTGKKLTDREARTLYRDSLRDLGLYMERLGEVDFKDDKVFVPLQAADLAAWQRRRRLCAKHEATRSDYARLHKHQGRFKHTLLDRQFLRETMDDIIQKLNALAKSSGSGA